MCVSLTNAYDKSLFSPIGDGKSFTSLDGLRVGLRTEQERSDKGGTRILDVLAEVASLNNPSPRLHSPPPPDKTWSTYTADQGGFHLTKQQNMQRHLSAPTGDACQATFSTAQECRRHVNQNNVHRYVFVLWKSSFPMYPPTPRKCLLPLKPPPPPLEFPMMFHGGRGWGVWIFSGTTQSDEQQ